MPNETPDIRNKILSALPPEQLEWMSLRTQRVSLEARDLLFDVNTRIDSVYFPESCVCSIVGVMADGSAVESATIGNEGVVGLPLFHGTDRTSSQAFCQVRGEALRLSTQDFLSAFRLSRELTGMLHRYSQALFTLVAQSSGCNRVHTTQQRCARWLLNTHDRVNSDNFVLTEQFLSQMLGIRRPSVVEAMSIVEDTGAIEYERGRIRIVDRSRLEGLACECYAIVRSEFDRLLMDENGSPTPNPLETLKTSSDGKSILGDAAPRD